MLLMFNWTAFSSQVQHDNLEVLWGRDIKDSTVPREWQSVVSSRLSRPRAQEKKAAAVVRNAVWSCFELIGSWSGNNQIDCPKRKGES